MAQTGEVLALQRHFAVTPLRPVASTLRYAPVAQWVSQTEIPYLNRYGIFVCETIGFVFPGDRLSAKCRCSVSRRWSHLKKIDMALIIGDDRLKAIGISEREAQQILAIGLHERGHISFGLAARLTELDRIGFQKLLGAQRVPSGPSVAELDREIGVLNRLGLA